MSGGRADAVTKRDGYRDSVFDASAPLNLDFKGYLSKKGEHHLATYLRLLCGHGAAPLYTCMPAWVVESDKLFCGLPETVFCRPWQLYSVLQDGGKLQDRFPAPRCGRPASC